MRLGTVSPRPTTTRYQWTVKGKRVSRATKPTYRIRRADRHQVLAVTITLRRAGYATKTVTVRVGRVR